MRLPLLCMAALLLAAPASAQIDKAYTQYNPRPLGYGSLPKDEKVEDPQRNFITQTWRTGTVRFRNTPEVVTVPLLFDVYSNQLYFLKDNTILEFLQPVKQFTIPVVVNGDTLQLVYRNGYPNVHRNNGETFYEVLADGNFQLLRCKAKTIALYKDQEVPEEQRDYSKELLYALLPNGKMIAVKKDRESVLKEMAEYAPAVERICTNEKLKLKNEAQLKQLFVALNKS